MYREVKFKDVSCEKQLNRNITVAPLHQSYALCVEYMKHWFLQKFDSDFFSWIHVDGSHVFGNITKLTRQEIMSHNSDDKAALTIIPTIDDDYNRDRLDQNLFGLDQFINTTKIDKAFLQDPVNHKYIMMKMDMMLLNFTYRVKVPSRAMQLDIQKYMKLAFRTNLSETQDVDLDYVMPYPMMLFIARDLGFEIKDDRICEPIKFLTYLNSRSYIPITYRRSNVNAREEYFVRVDHLPVRLLIKDVTKDDGDKYGHLSDNFNIEMQVEVRFPSMQLFIYFTKEEFTSISFGKEAYNIDNTLMMSLHYYDDPPAVNDKGWKLTINAQWEEEKPSLINIDLNELFDGELSQISNYLVSKFISPNVFIDIQIYSAGMKLEDVNIDWCNMKLTAKNPTNKLVSTLAIYIDLDYLNSVRVESYKGNNSKVMISDPNRSY